MKTTKRKQPSHEVTQETFESERKLVEALSLDRIATLLDNLRFEARNAKHAMGQRQEDLRRKKVRASTRGSQEAALYRLAKMEFDSKMAAAALLQSLLEKKVGDVWTDHPIPELGDDPKKGAPVDRRVTLQSFDGDDLVTVRMKGFARLITCRADQVYLEVGRHGKAKPIPKKLLQAFDPNRGNT